MGPDDPYGPDDTPWYQQPGPVAVLVIVVLLIAGLLAWLIFGGDDDDDTIDTSPTTELVTTLETTAPEETTTTLEPVETTIETTTTAVETTLPPETTVAPATTIPVVTVPPQPDATLWDIIVNSPDLSGLRGLIELAGLQDVLSDPAATLTLFAPSNTAIELAAAGVGAPDFTDPAVVRDILLTHVHTEGVLLAVDVLGLSEVTVANGGPHAIDASATPPTIGGGGVLVVDVTSSNGVIHVIDLVLQP
jgi:uncharacterized surface protein with fasciclin (FAS1) repeats